MALTLYTYLPNYRAAKALIASQYNNVAIEVPTFNLQVDNVTPQFLAKNPLGKVPVLDTPNGSIFESNAIARYVARLRPDTDLYGSSFFESALVDQWIDFSANELEPTRAIWLFPVLGYMQYDEEAYNCARDDMIKTLQVLEEHLSTRTYLVGQKITLADIAVACALVDLFAKVFDANFRKPFVNLTRWFTTCVNQPQFAQVLGTVTLATKEEKAQGAPAASKQAKKNKGQKQQKQQKKKGGKKKGGAAAEEKKAPKPKKKAKNPLLLLPKSSMNLDATKKLYFEYKNQQGNEAGFWPDFWSNHWDPEGYSFWTANYNYDGDNAMFWMTGNLIGGWIQRLESLRKFGFGCVLITGVDEETAPFSVKSVWLIRGTSMCEELGGCPDSEYHTFTKVDVSTPAGKAEIQSRFLDNTYGGQAVLDRRFFK